MIRPDLLNRGGNYMWINIWIVLLLGYLLLGRTFAYIGLLQYKIFIGEVILGAYFLFKPSKSWREWINWLLYRSYFSRLGTILFVFILYSIFQMIRCSYWGGDNTQALQNLSFNYYPLYVFLGLYIGEYYPYIIRKIFLCLAWANGIYGCIWVLWLNRLEFTLSWAPEVPLFGQPAGSVISILGLLALDTNPIRLVPLFLLNFFVLLGVQVRGEWLAISVGLIIWVFGHRNIPRIIFLISIIVIIFSLVTAFDVTLPAPVSRGGQISFSGVVGRILAPLNVKLAAGLVGEDAYSFAGTVVNWRIPWWQTIWHEIHKSWTTALLGMGYGYPLYSLVSFIPEGLRTPHNSLMFALGYGGWINVVLFLMLQLSLLRLMSDVAKIFQNIFPIMLWASLFISSLWGNYFETPFGAIPFYLLTGYFMAFLRLYHEDYSNSYTLSTTRRRGSGFLSRN